MKSYKQRFIYICSGFIVIIFLSYYFSISKTIQEIKQTDQLSKLVSYTNENETFFDITQKVNYYDSLITKQNLLNNPNYLLYEINSFSAKKKIRVANFTAPEASVKDNFTFFDQTIEVEGDFFQLLRLLHHLEQESDIRNIAGIELVKYKDRQTRKLKLKCLIYLQNFKKNE